MVSSRVKVKIKVKGKAKKDNERNEAAIDWPSDQVTHKLDLQYNIHDSQGQNPVQRHGAKSPPAAPKNALQRLAVAASVWLVGEWGLGR